MYSKSDQLFKNKKPKITNEDREYLNWLNENRGAYPCFVCGRRSGIEYHHITDIHRIEGKRREHKRVVPLCFMCHRVGKNAIHNMSKMKFYSEVKSLEELLNRADELYEDFKNVL